MTSGCAICVSLRYNDYVGWLQQSRCAAGQKMKKLTQAKLDRILQQHSLNSIRSGWSLVPKAHEPT
jgi:hypothetical protein